MRWPLQPLQPFQQTQLQPPFGQSVDSLCHPWFTTTNVSYRFPILKLPPPPCAVLLVIWLVDSTPLKNMKVSWNMSIPNIWKNQIHVRNHQQVIRIQWWLIYHYYSYPSAAQVTNLDFIGPSCGSPTASVTDSVGALLRGSRRSRITWDFFVLAKPEMNGLMIDLIWPGTIGSRTTFFELKIGIWHMILPSHNSSKTSIWPWRIWFGPKHLVCLVAAFLYHPP